MAHESGPEMCESGRQPQEEGPTPPTRAQISQGEGTNEELAKGTLDSGHIFLFWGPLCRRVAGGRPLTVVHTSAGGIRGLSCEADRQVTDRGRGDASAPPLGAGLGTGGWVSGCGPL